MIGTGIGAATLAAILTLFGQLGLAACPTCPPDFRECIEERGAPVLILGTFAGVECVAPDGERWYSGVVWIDGAPTIQTGP